MNSLRTDDIMGAMPRVRHMPKNLVRERKIPSYFSINLQHYNPELQYNYQTKSPRYSPPQVNFQNNMQDSTPFVQRNSLNKESKFINYSMLEENDSKIYQRKQDSRQHKNYQQKVSQHVQHRKVTPLHIQQKEQASSERAISRKSEQSRKSSYKEIRESPKQIFRGVGFNIINNNKFEYSLQKSFPRQ